MANEEKPEIKPEVKFGNVIKPEDVRHFIMDRSVEDNLLHLDLYFDENEILNAMRFAALEFNNIPPLSMAVNPERMPFQMTFLYGTVYHLYLAKLQQLMRNNIKYEAGGVQTTLVEDQIKALSEMMPLYKEEFYRLVKQMKQYHNIQNAFGIFTI